VEQYGVLLVVICLCLSSYFRTEYGTRTLWLLLLVVVSSSTKQQVQRHGRSLGECEFEQWRTGARLGEPVRRTCVSIRGVVGTRRRKDGSLLAYENRMYVPNQVLYLPRPNR
jgi:hypothetical protein